MLKKVIAALMLISISFLANAQGGQATGRAADPLIVPVQANPAPVINLDDYAWFFDGTVWVFAPIVYLDPIHLDPNHMCPDHPPEPSPPVAAVPLPAAGWLFLSVLFGLTILGRHKKTLVK